MIFVSREEAEREKRRVLRRIFAFVGVVLIVLILMRARVTVDGLTGNFTVKAPPKPAEFVLSDLTITPAEVELGPYRWEEVAISFLVTNIGEQPGNYTFLLRVEGLLLSESAEFIGILEAGESETHSYALTPDTLGSYSVEVDDLTGSFEVVPVVIPPRPAEFVVSDLEITPEEVEEGLAVTITVEVENIGEKEGNYTVLLEVDGLVTELAEVTLEGGESTTVTFTITEAVGDHNFRIEDLTGDFTVTPAMIVWWMRPVYIACMLIVIASAGAIIYALRIRARRHGGEG